MVKSNRSAIGASFADEQWVQVNFMAPRSLKNVVARLAEYHDLNQGEYILKICMEACIANAEVLKSAITTELHELDALLAFIVQGSASPPTQQ